MERYNPMQSAETDALPVGDNWVYEPQLDGLRIVARKSPTSIRLFTQHISNYNHSFPEIARELPGAIQASQALVDGEIVALDKRGRTDRSLLYQPLAATIIFYAFDLLQLDEEPLIQEPWIIRRQFLEHIIKEQTHIKLVTTFDKDEVSLLQRPAKRKGISGIIAKRVDSPYLPGKASDDAWQQYSFPPSRPRVRRRKKIAATE